MVLNRPFTAGDHNGKLDCTYSFRKKKTVYTIVTAVLSNEM